MTTTALFLGLSVNTSASFMQDYLTDPDDGMLDASRYLSEVPMGFLPVPTLITEPATGFGLAVMGIFFHESDEQKKERIDKNSKKGHYVLPHNISVLGVGATENGSKGGGVGHMGFWFEDRLRYKGYLLYPDFNLDFYSLGGTTLPKPIELNISGPVMVQTLKARLGKSHWFAGLHQVYRQVETQLAEPLKLDFSPIPAINNSINNIVNNTVDQDITTSGLGLVLEYDSRNNPMNPQQGYDYQLDITRFDETLGSDVDYYSYHIEGLNYWQLSTRFDFALRLQFDAVDADGDQQLPSYVPPSIDLRGVPAIRYQGNQVIVGEIELSYKLNQRWKFNTFTGTGRAAQSFDDLSKAHSAENVGIGFRYLVAKRYGFIMGSDIARGPEDTAFYIQAGSTW
ncbi:MAG: BamA/TamA family outer membrane protein [Pseudomonadales bacterium]|nr:BamA/TamA family outer membrane protein [Pseudomonadales bacterium]